MNIVITAPTGHVGTHLVNFLVQANAHPRLLAHHKESLPDWVFDYADVVELDIFNTREVIKATKNLDSIYWVSPSKMDDDPIAAHLQSGIALTNAIAANSIKNVVFQSGIGAEKREGVGEIDGLADIEQLLEQSSANVTHLRCAYFYTNLLLDLDQLKAGILSSNMNIKNPFPWIAPIDIAYQAALHLLNPSSSKQTIKALHGPKDYSFLEVAQLLSKLTSLKVSAVQVSDEELTSTLTSFNLPPKVIDSIVKMGSGTRETFLPEQKRSPLTTTPTTLESWIVKNF